MTGAGRACRTSERAQGRPERLLSQTNSRNGTTLGRPPLSRATSRRRGALRGGLRYGLDSRSWPCQFCPSPLVRNSLMKSKTTLGAQAQSAQRPAWIA